MRRIILIFARSIVGSEFAIHSPGFLRSNASANFDALQVPSTTTSNKTVRTATKKASGPARVDTAIRPAG
jgi:hypothetical protein